MNVYVVMRDYGYDGGTVLDSVFSDELGAKLYCAWNTTDNGDFPFDGSVIYDYEEKEVDEKHTEEV